VLPLKPRQILFLPKQLSSNKSVHSPPELFVCTYGQCAGHYYILLSAGSIFDLVAVRAELLRDEAIKAAQELRLRILPILDLSLELYTVLKRQTILDFMAFYPRILRVYARLWNIQQTQHPYYPCSSMSSSAAFICFSAPVHGQPCVRTFET
jgi:hypothetical protein